MKKIFVADASVAVKWIFPADPKEDNTEQALNLLKAFKQNMIQITQPVHWLAETIAVVLRIEPKVAEQTLHLLSAMEIPIANEVEIYSLACRLTEMLNHHLFDTLYHAVALSHGNSQFVTADLQYYRKAKKYGSMILLSEFSLFEEY